MVTVDSQSISNFIPEEYSKRSLIEQLEENSNKRLKESLIKELEDSFIGKRHKVGLVTYGTVVLQSCNATFTLKFRDEVTFVTITRGFGTLP